MTRVTRGVLVVNLVVLVGFFLAAELMRDANTRTSTLLSMFAWLAFALFFLLWARGQRRWPAFLGDLCSLGVLASLSLAVLYAYYARSQTLAAGIHVDSVYTYIGLKWFTELRNPITFAGLTPSYHQFPMMLFTHLPALALGFGRLGAFSAHLGIMLQIAVLLAVTTMALSPGRLASQAVTVALLSAVFSNRMLVLTHDKTGYGIPAICLGLMFLIAVDAESTADPDRTIGGLLSLAMLHYYTGFVLVLLPCLAWLIVRWHPVARLRSFVVRNPVVPTVILLFLITLVTHPGLLMTRIQDVTVQKQAAPLETLVRKARTSLPYLLHTYPRGWYEAFCVRTPGSWHLLNVPPLGGLLLPLLGGSWLLSFWTMRERGLRYPLYLLAFATLLIALSALQHLLTDFADYRDFTLVFAMLVTGFLFVLRGQRLDARRRVTALAFAVMLSVYNYVDLGNLHGKLHGSPDYAYLSQESMEHLSAFVRRRGPAQLGVARIAVVVDPFFPLESLYVEDLQRRGFSVQIVNSDAFCAEPAKALDSAASAGCDGFLFVANAKHCPRWDETVLEPADRPVRGYLYETACGRPDGDVSKRPRVPVDLDSGL